MAGALRDLGRGGLWSLGCSCLVSSGRPEQDRLLKELLWSQAHVGLNAVPSPASKDLALFEPGFLLDKWIVMIEDACDARMRYIYVSTENRSTQY